MFIDFYLVSFPLRYIHISVLDLGRGKLGTVWLLSSLFPIMDDIYTSGYYYSLLFSFLFRFSLILLHSHVIFPLLSLLHLLFSAIGANIQRRLAGLVGLVILFVGFRCGSRVTYLLAPYIFITSFLIRKSFAS